MCVPSSDVITVSRTKKEVEDAEKVAKARAKKFLGEYTKEMYVIDIVCFYLGAALMAVDGALLVRSVKVDILLHLVFVLVLANLSADISTGMVHWLADTYGSVDLPVIGKSLIRPFRFHHVDPVAMCRVSVYETSGSNHMAVSPVLGVLLYYLLQDTKADGQRQEELATYLNYTYVYLTMVFIAFTNLFHRWSHLYKTPAWINFLQATPFVISKAHHREHHVNPHEVNYCITCGLMNYPLEYIGFFRKLEYAIERITGSAPRVDDAEWLETTKAGRL